jgi:SAGA-associated factor 11
MSVRRNPPNLTNSEMESVSKQIFDECLDELVLGVAFEIHRSVKTGLFAIMDAAADKSASIGPSRGVTPMDTSSLNSLQCVDVFGQVISTTVGVPALKKQPECVCPNCQRNLAASRFAPHLEKCMGMGRNSSRLASRRLATAGKEASYRESGEGEDEDDEEWIEPTKVSSTSRRRHRDKNSPRRSKLTSSGSRFYSSTGSSSRGDIYFVTAPDGTVTPPSSFDVLSIEERSNLLATVCGVITAASKKICTRSIRCPMHTEAQRREVRNRWLTHDDETHVDIDR